MERIKTMRFPSIVRKLTDTDLYKFTMWQVFDAFHSNREGTYQFKCRNKDVKFTTEMVEEIKLQLEHLASLRFTEEELNYLATIRFIKKGFISKLRCWHFQLDYLKIELADDGTLSITANGPIFDVSPYEIYVLEIVNEVYFRMSYDYDELRASAEKKLNDKIAAFNSGKYTFKFAEFGTRRRLSGEWQDEVVRRFAAETKGAMVGTSNVYLAMKYGLTPVGTFAHEYVELYQAIWEHNPAYSNKFAMEDWFKFYRGDNGTALTDTITTDAFLADFGLDMASTYTGVRHDSGDPYEWGDKMIAHYKSLNIDPRTKTLLFSDSLDFDKAQALYDYFKDKAKVSFGIGTFVTNDTCVPALNIVMKLQAVDGRPVAKLSDNVGKTMGDSDYVEYLKRAIKFRLDYEKKEG